MPARMDDERDATTGKSRPIVHRRGAIRTELALLALIIGTLAATCNLLVAIQRHADTTPRPPDPPATVALTPQSPDRPSSPVTPVSPKPAIVQQPPPPVEVLPPPEDPTKKVLAGLTKATGLEVEAAQQADRRASALEAARAASEAESRRWKRREMLVRQQISGLTARADQLESAASLLDAERDVLAKERDALKAALAKAGRRSGYSVLPYKGPNGTWRRPIVLECTSGGVKIQPKGLTFTGMDLSPLINPRSSPLIMAIAHEMLQIRASDTPDGAAAVPYLVFLVRPGGIRLYYQARTCLEPLGIAFGYELIEQDLAVDIPDLNNLATWDGSVPLDLPLEPAPRPKVNVALNASSEPGNGTSTGARTDRPASNGWPVSPGSGGPQSAASPGNGGTDTPEDFVWPSRGGHNAANDGRGSLPSGSGESGGYSAGGGGLMTPGSGAVRNGSSASETSNGSFGSPKVSPGGSVLLSPGAREGEAPSEPGQTSASGAAFGDRSRRGSSGSGLYPGGGTGSSLSPGGGRSNGSPGGGAGSSFASGAGIGASAPPSGGFGSSPSAATREGEAPPEPGQTFASGSNPTTGSAGGRSLSPSGNSPVVSGSAADGTANGGMNALPDLEPAGDGGFVPPLTTPGLVPPGGLAGAGSGAGGPYRSAGAGQAGAGSASAGGPGSTSASPGGGGQSQGAAAISNDSGSGGPAGARLGVDPAPAGGGTAGEQPGSPSAGNDLATQPYAGLQAGSAADSQVSVSPGGRLATALSANAGGQPPAGMNVPGGLTLPSSALASAAASGLGMPSGSSSSSPPSSSSSSSSSPSLSGLGTPSGSGSSSSMSSSSASGGMPFGTPSSDNSSTPASGLSLGQSGSASSESSSSSDNLIFPPAPKPIPKASSIEIPYEIVVVCRRNDVLLHPGGYRLTTQALEHQGPSNDGLLAREIVAMVRKRAIVDPLIRPKPKIKFLVETDGGDTFWTARRQLLFSLPDWPMSLHVSGPQGSHVFTKETW